jgi:lipopolysaccharide biosynthesis regulator YciM
MPTESAFLLAGLLFVAAALGYMFARFGETDDEEGASEKFSTDYLKGLNYVLNEEPDRAVELFTRMAELDDEALETHFALGSLFRKRGEVERAIRVHQNLMARPSLGRDQRDQAEAALAEDYLSAGLFDRAENLFENLLSSQEFRQFALKRLVRIYEITKEWDRAIEYHAELESMEANGKESSEVAHYYCELAEEARVKKDFSKARAMLKKSESGRQRTVRSVLTRANVAHDSGNEKEAIRLYKQVIDKAPELLMDVIPRFAAACRAADVEDQLTEFLRKLLSKDKHYAEAIAMAAVRDPELQDPVALDALQHFIAGDSTLSGLVDVATLESAGEVERVEILTRVRQALVQIVASKPGYRCVQCGYASLLLRWQCPGCRSWETVKAETGIKLV